MTILQDFVIVNVIDFRENLIEQFEWELDDELLDIDIDTVFDDRDNILNEPIRFNEIFEDFISDITDETVSEHIFDYIEGILTEICISFIDEDYNLVCSTIVQNIEQGEYGGFDFDFITYDFRNNKPRIKVMCKEIDEEFYNDGFDEYDEYDDYDDEEYGD